ncbi:MAG: stage V sporulation protein AB [Lachnospiraceae bacterium]|nr:stage V sporulation protein AB [Lachnospiraceae bacterium]
MWSDILLQALIGFGGGAVVAAGVFALVSAIGIIPRLADKSHTAKYISRYEDSVVFGGILGNIIYVYEVSVPIGVIGGIIFGAFAGIYAGVLAISLAEATSATAIFSRRANLKKGLGAVVLAFALGKGFGAFLMFFERWG